MALTREDLEQLKYRIETSKKQREMTAILDDVVLDFINSQLAQMPKEVGHEGKDEPVS